MATATSIETTLDTLHDQDRERDIGALCLYRAGVEKVAGGAVLKPDELDSLRAAMSRLGIRDEDLAADVKVVGGLRSKHLEHDRLIDDIDAISKKYETAAAKVARLEKQLAEAKAEAEAAKKPVERIKLLDSVINGAASTTPRIYLDPTTFIESLRRKSTPPNPFARDSVGGNIPFEHPTFPKSFMVDGVM